MSEQVCVGAVAGAYGVKGLVRLKSFCAEADAMADYGTLSDEAGQIQYTLTLTGRAKGVLIGKLSGVTSKEDADRLRGTRLYAPRAALPQPSDDEYYYADLVGLAVYDTGGVMVGQVKALHDYGAGDVIEIAPSEGGETRLLPFTLDNVPSVDLATRRIVIDPPEGF